MVARELAFGTVAALVVTVVDSDEVISGVDSKSAVVASERTAVNIDEVVEAVVA